MWSIIVITVAQSALAAPPGCPDSADVARAAAALVRGGEDDAAPDFPLEVLDRGASFVVRVGPNEREFPDPARNCAERTRIAAVYVAMNAPAPRPPQAPSSKPPPPPPPTPAARPEAPPRPRLGFVLDVGATAQGGWLTGTAGTPRLVGGGLRAGMGTPALAVVIGASFARGDAPLPNEARVVYESLAFDVGARRSVVRETLAFEPELGLRGTRLALRGDDLLVTREGVRLQLGLRAAVTLRARPRHFIRPFASFELTWVPSPTSLSLGSQGPAGSTPTLWAGLFLGLGFGLR